MTTLSKNALAARSAAKMFGGVALKGTARQVEWAEKIRLEKITDMTEKQALIACDPAGLMKGAKFWIENRDRSGRDVGEFAVEYRDLIEKYNNAKSAGDASTASETAAKYNALTLAWGFE